MRNPAQEHSLVPSMWQRFSRPDVLIYLDLNYDEARRRRPHQDGGPQRLAQQHARLAHALAHADLYVNTTGLSAEDVRSCVLDYLNRTLH